MPEGSVNPSNGGPMDDEGGRVTYALKHTLDWFVESPRLSTASVSSNERAPSATPSDLSDAPPTAGQPPRPVSLISTLSSGSTSSRDDSLAPPTSESSGSNPAHIDLELRPPEGHAHTDTGEDTGPGGGRGHCRGWVHQRTNKEPVPTATGDDDGGSMPPNPQLTYLDRVVMEIIETERMYVRDLRMIVEDYLSHIIDQAELSIRPEQVCSLFGNIEDIYEFNSELLQSLDLCDNDPVAVARCFVMKTEDFDIYTQYCTNYPNSVAALTECMRNKSLAKFFRERQATLKRSLPLGSYLLKPVQRILKYHLLLQEIAKHFDPEEEEGYEVVQEAIFTMTGVAWYINDMKRKHEHSVRLQEVQSLLLNWKGADLTTYGELVLEGTFKVHRAKNERTLFLFERVLLITKRRGDHYVYKSHISCSTLMLMESSKDSLCFSVTHYKHPKQPTTVQARTVEEKKLWTHHIKRLLLENHHAIIPQKAKEAILEMDSVYRSRYRYSPDRLKKTLSCQSDEGPRPRPLSEPNTQAVKNSNAVLKHADSEGFLPGDGGSSDAPLGGPDAAPHERCEAEVVHNNSDDEGRPNSPEHLSASDNEEEEEEEGARTEGTEGTEEDTRGDTEPADGSDTEDMMLMMQDEQAEEFSCSDRADDTGDELQHKQSSVENPAEPTGGIEPAALPSDPDRTPIAPPPTLSTSPRRTAPPADKVSSPGTPESDSKTLSSAESSDEDEKETSILPSSVLDQAGVIALHFSTSTRRGSVPADDTRSLGCPSPRLPSRNGSTLSLAAEPADRSHRLNSACSDAQENFGTTDLTLLSPREDSLFDGDLRGGGGALRRRRDSTLSKQDQLLIGKIKCYYETAESEDPVFSLRRRESLSYIPAGLVRNSVTRINSIPKDPTSDTAVEASDKTGATAEATDKRQPPETAWSDDSPSLVPEAGSSLAADSSLSAPGSRGRPASSESRDSVGPDRPQHVREERPVEDEEFKPSCEMIKIWRAMERDVCGTQGEVGHRGGGGGGREKRSRELARNSRVSGPSLSNRNQTPKKNGAERDSGAGESDLTTIKEESAGPSPLKTTGLSRSGGLRAVRRSCDEEGGLLRARLPRVQQLRAEAEGERSRDPEPLDDEEDKTKSKVMNLARRYSQKIKSSKPVVQHRSPHKKLPCVLEETDSGKPTLSLPLTPSHETPSLRLRLTERGVRPPPSPAAPTSDTTTTGGPRPLSLVSPVVQNPGARSPTEGFPWPHVRELRSKYVPDPDLAQLPTPPVVRSQSVPERLFDGGARRRSSCSSNLFQASSASASHQYHLSREERRSARLHRTSSLDHRLSRAHPSDPEKKHTHTVKLPNGGHHDNGGYYISGSAPLPGRGDGGGRKLVVVEKVPDSSPSGGAVEPGVEMAQEAREEAAAAAGAGQEVDDGDNYVQIRSPTSREKMSIMAVIERCRAYQESDEYKQREENEAGPKAEPVAAGGRGKETGGASTGEEGTAPASTEQKTDDGTQSIVKNLREKFQNLK